MKLSTRTGINIYDLEAWKEFSLYVKSQDKCLGEYIWSLILQDLSKMRIEKQDQTIRLTNFSLEKPPPLIIEDFTHVIRTYMKNATLEEIKLITENGYNQHRYGSYLIYALKLGKLSDNARKNTDISLESAEEGLTSLENITGQTIPTKNNIKPKGNF